MKFLYFLSYYNKQYNKKNKIKKFLYFKRLAQKNETDYTKSQ
jgi:hypothetical protein